VNNAKKYEELTYCSRYNITIVNGAKNPLRSAVLKDIYDSILLSRAGKGTHTKYRNKEEQLKKLTDVYEKYAWMGTVWSAATSKVRTLVIGIAILHLPGKSRHTPSSLSMWKGDV
jgi:hypothetical protein